MAIRSFFWAVIAFLGFLAGCAPTATDCNDCVTDGVTDDVNTDPFDGPGVPVVVTRLGEVEDCQVNVESDWFGADKTCDSDSLCVLNPIGDWTFTAGNPADVTPENIPIHVDRDGFRWISTPVTLDSLEDVEEVELPLFPYYGTEPGGEADCKSYQNGELSREFTETDIFVDSQGHLKLPEMLGNGDAVVFNIDGTVNLADPTWWTDYGYVVDHDATVLRTDFFSVTITDGVWPYTYECQF